MGLKAESTDRAPGSHLWLVRARGADLVRCHSVSASTGLTIPSGSVGLWYAHRDSGQRRSLKNSTTSSVRVLT